MTTSLQAVLEDRAATAPEIAPVLAAVHAGVRRRRRHRTTALTTGSAFAVGGVICAAVLLPQQADAPTAPPATIAGQPSVASTAPASTGESESSVSVRWSGLESIAPAPSAVALSLTRVPIGFVYLGQAADDVGAWGPAGTPLAGGFADKLVVQAAVPDSAPVDFTTTAAGHPAGVRTDDGVVSVVVEVTDETRVVVQFPVGLEISTADALQVADSLEVRRVVLGGVG